MENPILPTDPWADWYREEEEIPKPPSYAILHYPCLGIAPDDVPLDPMTRADLVAHHVSPSPLPPPTLSTLSSASPHIITIDPYSTRGGNKACIHHATFAMDGRPLLNVVLKTYPVEDFNLLIHEFDVYTAVAHLAVVVPTLHAVVKSRFEPWGGLILEDAGTVLSKYDIPWKALGLTPQDKVVLYDTLRQLHAAGVLHGDVAPRNILRRPSGAFCLVDFDRSTLNHVCPGPTCEELSELQRVLALVNV